MIKLKIDFAHKVWAMGILIFKFSSSKINSNKNSKFYSVWMSTRANPLYFTDFIFFRGEFPRNDTIRCLENVHENDTDLFEYCL